MMVCMKTTATVVVIASGLSGVVVAVRGNKAKVVVTDRFGVYAQWFQMNALEIEVM